MKAYRLADFTDKEIALAKQYIRKALEGFFAVKGDEQVDKLFKQLERTSFTANDTISFNFTIDTIGNDILAALGAARNSLK